VGQVRSQEAIGTQTPLLIEYLLQFARIFGKKNSKNPPNKFFRTKNFENLCQ